MKFGIIGTGAVGGYYGGLLARHGYDVHFLLHSDYEYVKKNGLAIESVNGNFTLPKVNAYSRAAEMPPCDVVIVSLKSTQNDLLSEILPHVVKKNGIIIILQNGLGVEEEIKAIVPHAVIMGGLCFLCNNKIGPGHIKHLDFGMIRLGEYHEDAPAGITENLQKIAQAFENAGIPVKPCENLGKARWEKLVWNMAYNGLSVVLNATTDQMMSCPSSYALIREIMIEVITAAHYCGYSLDETFVDEMLKTTETMAVYSPSMKLDFKNGRPLEIEAIYWRPITAAESAGFNMHKSRVIALQLEFIDQYNQSSSR